MWVKTFIFYFNTLLIGIWKLLEYIILFNKYIIIWVKSSLLTAYYLYIDKSTISMFIFFFLLRFKQTEFNQIRQTLWIEQSYGVIPIALLSRQAGLH